MDFSYNSYLKLNNPELRLCNPDRKELAVIQANDRSVCLRLNDISTIDFIVPSKITDWKGNNFTPTYYDKIATRRLIYVTDIGWFVITNVEEKTDGTDTYKSVSAESHQAVFKDKGFYCEDRMYKFYDEDDIFDDKYDASNPASIPSIVGQLKKQIGININLQLSDITPEADYGEWTLVYIDPSLRYVTGSTSNICRAFTETTVTGYDFMANTVQEAFEMVFVFDFLHHTIKVKAIQNITQQTNIFLAFENVLQNMVITEKSDEIITVLTCNGTDLDIRSVNPSGTNYIVDFSYYMDEVNHEWMSDALIAKLKTWSAAVETKKTEFTGLVSSLRIKYQSLTEEETKQTSMNIKLQDLGSIRDQFSADATTKNNIFSPETILIGEKSRDAFSIWHTTNLSNTAIVTCYTSTPKIVYDESGNPTKFSFSGTGTSGTLTENYNTKALYFTDGKPSSYCKIVAAAVIDASTETATYEVSGVERYTFYKEISLWHDIYEAEMNALTGTIKAKELEVENVNSKIKTITNTLNIQNYFSDTPSLLTELKSYWYEGDYTNDTLAVLESTTPAEAISLANELLTSGKTHLSKVCQPKYSFSVDVINFLGIYEFRDMMESLELGSIVSAEKSSGVVFYPAVTAIDFSLDDKTSFSLTFSNALRLDDWGYTYADLITSSSATSKTVTANWRDLTSYIKDKETITGLIANPLDRALRASFGNMYNQEFTVDSTGILGRKLTSSGGSFENEQVRFINNLLLFTDDGWKSSKTAIGKISYTDNGVDCTAYGLIAETLIGSLIMGEKLKIINADNTILLDNSGITIKNSLSETVFDATTTGNVYVKGEIVATKITLSEGVTIAGYVTANNGSIFSNDYSYASGNYSTNGMKIDLADKYIRTPNFSLDNNGSLFAKKADITGIVNATSGTIGGLLLENGNLKSSNFELGTINQGGVGKSYLNFLAGNGQATTSITETDINSPLLSTLKLTSDYIITSTATIGGLNFNGSTINGNSTSIELDASPTITHYMATLSYSEWDNLLTVTVATPLISTQTFCIQYKVVWESNYKSTTVTIPAGAITGATEVSAFWGISDARFLDLQNGKPTGTSYHFNQSLGGKLIKVLGSLLPSDNSCDLGDASNRWKDCYLSGGVNTNSDRNLKNTISYLSPSYDSVFDKLIPVSFKYNANTSNRTHTGLIAQDLKDAIITSGLTTQDLAAYCESVDGNGNIIRSIRYEELIALCIYQIQKLKQRVKELEQK